MNNSAKIDAFKSYYSQAGQLNDAGDTEQARKLYIKAAALANEISVESDSYNVRMEYHDAAERILKYLKGDYNKKTVAYTDCADEEKKKNAVSFEEKDSGVRFSDVAGLADVKEEILFNVIEPLKNPSVAEKYHITPGAKILLYGPPGTGKTYIARAIAGEIDAKFFSVNCQDLISKYMGESSKQIDLLFEEAEKNKRAIIFFDEFDSVASRRESDNGSVAGEMARFVATFLTKVDGFKKPKECEMLLLIAATNRPWAIDPAMLRGGRFDIHIYVGLPDKEARCFLINKELSGVELSGFNIDYLADKLAGYGGADIVASCRKILQLTYRRALKTRCYEAVSLEDINKVLASIRPSVSDADLEQFIRFKKGV